MYLFFKKNNNWSVNQSITYFLLYIIGPLVSGLLNKFGSREVVIVGTLISTISILASTFIYNLDLFIVIFGICGGKL